MTIKGGSQSKVRILGVDPGSRFTGYGCLDLQGKHLQHVQHGVLRLEAEAGSSDFEKRLLALHRRLGQLIEELSPQVLVVEKVFFAKNAMSALKLGQARGVVLLSAAFYDLELVEYSPTEVKQALTGHGRAGKDQVSRLVQMLLGKHHFETEDASDALAIALCHSQYLINFRSRQSMNDRSQAKTSFSSNRSHSLGRALGLQNKK